MIKQKSELAEVMKAKAKLNPLLQDTEDPTIKPDHSWKKRSAEVAAIKKKIASKKDAAVAEQLKKIQKSTKDIIRNNED